VYRVKSLFIPGEKSKLKKKDKKQAEQVAASDR
jgi:hypothetical protein